MSAHDMPKSADTFNGSWRPVLSTPELKAQHEAFAQKLLDEGCSKDWESDARIIYIEYHDHEPHEVVTESTNYFMPRQWLTGAGNAASWYNSHESFDIDDGMIHASGGGGGTDFDPGKLASPSVPPTSQVWAAPHCTLPDDETLRKNGWERLPEPLGNPWEAENAREVDGTVYCSICRQHYADDDECSHLFWTENGHGGPGADEIDPGGVKESFWLVLRKTGIAKPLLKSIEAKDMRLTVFDGMIEQFCTLYLCGEDYGKRFDNRLLDGGKAGCDWLSCLDFEETVEAIELTKQWVREFIRASRKRRFRQSGWMRGAL